MLRVLLALFSLGVLTACDPNPPNDVAYPETEARDARDAELTGEAALPTPGDAESNTIPPATQLLPSQGNPSLSDENDFGAVSSRETIESDAERLRLNSENYRVIRPQALPGRPATGPNIVDYALSTSHAVGTSMFKRHSIAGAARAQRNCASYTSPDLAQRDFLARGGPERDPKGLDPDGDGYACAWDPAPFRNIDS